MKSLEDGSSKKKGGDTKENEPKKKKRESVFRWCEVVALRFER